jgi:NADP-dependent aldehyde dehydrogenase
VVPRETALPAARAKSELGRTCAQLRLFAALVEDGGWVDARIDHGDPARRPAPRPDLRSMLRPLGPVAVFPPANFPLAFSVAGGDTAAALAGGNPVVVKAHPGHPVTSEICGLAVRAAVAACGFDDGVFSLLFDHGFAVGTALVAHPAIRAVGFTGSYAGGRALMDIAAARPVPIPVFAEMGSVNPVVVTAPALAARGGPIAEALAASLLLGGGQFCTRPGMIVVEGAAPGFAARLRELLLAAPALPMLTPGIAQRYRAAVAERAARPGVATALVAAGPGNTGCPALHTVDAERFLADPALRGEVFGPCALLVAARDRAEVLAVLAALPGQLAASLWIEADDAGAAALLAALERCAGRVVRDGVPTGVEVAPAMVHGGPYPATSDGRSSAVGTAAILRFVRRVCYQDLPEALLPPALQSGNPLGVWRSVDGTPTAP